MLCKICLQQTIFLLSRFDATAAMGKATAAFWALCSLLMAAVHFVRSQVVFFFVYFDPVKEDPAAAAVERFPRFPLLFSIATLSLGFYGLGPTWSFHRALDLRFYQTDRYILYHQVSPTHLWTQTDTINFINLVGLFAMLTAMLRVAPIDRRYLFVRQGSMRIDDPIWSCHRRARQCLLPLFCLLFTFNLSSAVANARQQATFLWLPRVILFWAIFPLFLFIINYVSLMLLLFGILSVHYIQIEQQLLLAQLGTFQRKLERASKTEQLEAQIHRWWWRLGRLHSSVLLLCRQMQAFNAFWNPLVTLFFVITIARLVYQAYLALFRFDQMQLAARVFFSVYSAYHLTALVTYTKKCAAVDKLNGTILAIHRHAVELMFGSLTRHCPPAVLLKAQSLDTPDQLRPYSFTLFSRHRITSMTFHEIISYVCALFIMTIERYR